MICSYKYSHFAMSLLVGNITIPCSRLLYSKFSNSKLAIYYLFSTCDEAHNETYDHLATYNYIAPYNDITYNDARNYNKITNHSADNDCIVHNRKTRR